MVECRKLDVCREPFAGNGAKPEPRTGTRAVVVIPVYKTQMSPAEDLSFRQGLRVLARYDIVLMAPESLDISEYERVAGQSLRVERFTDSFFTGIKGYNALLVSAHFYLRFQDYDYMLIYQLDAWVFSDQLQNWCDRGYDYVGAPWFQDFLSHEHAANLWRSGNGGLSLRKIKRFIAATESGLPRQIFEQQGHWEDRCFTSGLDETPYRMSSPTAFEAAEFAFEKSPEYLFGLTGKLPFGCHAWEANGFVSFWRHHIPHRLPAPTGTRLSIVTITYNNLAGLKRTADSILGQNWRDYEWIVIDGGSTDGTVEFLKEISPAISFWCSERDGGVYDAQNKGLAHCHCDYVNFMNAGDMFMDHSVLGKVMIPYPWADVVYSNWVDVKGDGPVMRVAPATIPADFFDYNWCNLCHQTLLIRTALLKERGYDTSYRIYADWVRWRELAHAGCSFSKVDTPICAYDARVGLSNGQNPAQQAEYASLKLKDEVLESSPEGDFHTSWRYRLEDFICCKLHRVHVDQRDIPPYPRELEMPDLLGDESSDRARTLSCVCGSVAKRVRGRTAILALEMVEGHLYYHERSFIELLLPLVDNLIVVGDRPIEPEDLQSLREAVLALDFGYHRKGALESYRRGMRFIADQNLVTEKDTLLLVHTSCWGPIYPFEAVLSEMERRHLDFWGLTSFSGEEGAYVQPYFYGISGRLVAAGHAARAFHESATPQSAMRDLIRGGRYWNTYVPCGAISGDPMRRPLTAVRDFHSPFVGRRNLCGECDEDIADTIRYIDTINHRVAGRLNPRYYKR